MHIQNAVQDYEEVWAEDPGEPMAANEAHGHCVIART